MLHVCGLPISRVDGRRVRLVLIYGSIFSKKVSIYSIKNPKSYYCNEFWIFEFNRLSV